MKTSSWKRLFATLLCLTLCLALGLAAAGAEAAETEKASGKVKITAQPKAASGAVGATVKFTVKASGSKLTYQWEVNKGSGWSKVSGAAAKKATLSVKVKATMNAWKYRCKVTDKNGSKANSKAAKLTVTPVIKTQPKKTSVVFGKDLTLKVKATGAGLKYQWQYKDFNSKKWVKAEGDTATKATLKVTSDIYMYDRQYRCVITDANKKKLTTKAVKITLKGPYSDGDFEYEIATNGGTYYQANINSVQTDEKKVTIPKYFGPIPVHGINASSFAGNKKMQTLNIQADLWYIGYNAFENCTALKSITVPASVSTIFPSAFAGCTALQEADLSGCTRLESIGENAFANCTSLKDVLFPDGLNTIGESAFENCSSLETFLPDNISSIGFSAFKGTKDFAVSFNAGTPTMAAAMQTALNYDIFYDTYHLWVQNQDSGKYEGYAVLVNSFVRTSEGIAKPTKIVIPEGIEVIAVEACAGNDQQYSNVKTIQLPSTVGILDQGAFRDCTGLESINLDHVTVIGDSAFANCSSLKELTLQGSTGTITMHGGFEGIGPNAFSGCTGLTLRVPAGSYGETYAQEHGIPYTTY